VRALRETFSATIGWPLIVWPYVSSFVIFGLSAATCSTEGEQRDQH
jgi:hypothetical protein